MVLKVPVVSRGEEKRGRETIFFLDCFFKEVETPLPFDRMK
jgi:hypothetical protein